MGRTGAIEIMRLHDRIAASVVDKVIVVRDELVRPEPLPPLPLTLDLDRVAAKPRESYARRLEKRLRAKRRTT